MKWRIVGLGYEIPFRGVLKVIRESFKAQENILEEDNQKILDYFHVACNCLRRASRRPVE